MKSLLILLTICISSVSFGQDNKVDGKGLRKGKWIIMYEDNFLYYDYMSKLLNLDKMLVTGRETKSEDEARYFEVVNYKKGTKQGEFQVYSATKNKSDKYPLIAKGEYKDGLITGDLIMVGYDNQTQIRLCYAEYENGKIKDQDIVIEEKAKNSSNNYYTFGLNHVKVYPVIKMKDGICIEQIAVPTTITKLDDFILIRFVKTDKGFTRYGHFSRTLKVAELDNNFQHNGLVSHYEETPVPFETTTLPIFRATMKNNKKHGTANWYDPKTGFQKEFNYVDGIANGPAYIQKYIFWPNGGYYKERANVTMEFNYVDGLLNGVAKLKTESGQTYVQATYKDGLLDGKYVTYYLDDGFNLIAVGPVCEETKNKRIDEIVEKNHGNLDRFEPIIPKLKKEGHTIITDGVFKFFEASYVNGIMDGKYNYYHSNGKKLHEGTVSDCGVVDAKWFDINGKVIYDTKERIRRIQEELKKEDEYFNTAVINCSYCNNPVKLSNAIITGSGCNCFYDYGEIQVLGGDKKYFDSRKCQSEYEKDCCRRNGYRFEK